MNRVCLSGWFVDRPKLTYGPCGLAFAELRLAVPRPRPYGAQKASSPQTDLVPCVAAGTLAVALYTWGEPRVRVELEGRLVAATHEGVPAEPPGGSAPARPRGDTLLAGALVVHADHARVLDDPLGCLDPEGPREAESLVPLAPRRDAA